MEALIKIGIRSIAYLWELVTNQKNKKIQEVQIQRDLHQAFIAYEKVSKTISTIITQEHEESCIAQILLFHKMFRHSDFTDKLFRELELKIKELEISQENQSI